MIRMIICKRPVPPVDHLQKAGHPVDHLQTAGQSGSSFARGWSLRMIICNNNNNNNPPQGEGGGDRRMRRRRRKRKIVVGGRVDGIEGSIRGPCGPKTIYIMHIVHSIPKIPLQYRQIIT